MVQRYNQQLDLSYHFVCDSCHSRLLVPLCHSTAWRIHHLGLIRSHLAFSRSRRILLLVLESLEVQRRYRHVQLPGMGIIRPVDCFSGPLLLDLLLQTRNQGRHCCFQNYSLVRPSELEDLHPPCSFIPRDCRLVSSMALWYALRLLSWMARATRRRDAIPNHYEMGRNHSRCILL